jgi:hypothetical protein
MSKTEKQITDIEWGGLYMTKKTTQDKFIISKSNFCDRAIKYLSQLDYAKPKDSKYLLQELIHCLALPATSSNTKVISDINDKIANVLQRIAKSLELGTKEIGGPSFIDIRRKIQPERNKHTKSKLEKPRIVFASFTDSLETILLVMIKGKYYYDIEKDIRKSLNNFYLADLLLAKLINVAKKAQNDKTIDGQVENLTLADDYIYFVKAFISSFLGIIHFEQYNYDDSYNFFCATIRLYENERPDITSDTNNTNTKENKNNSNASPIKNNFSKLAENLYRISLLRKAKLVIEYGKIAEGTKWLVKALDQIVRLDIRDYEAYINSILLDDVIDKEYLISFLSSSVLTNLGEKFDKPLDDQDKEYIVDIIIRLIYCIYLLRPPQTEEVTGQNYPWSKGHVSLDIIYSLFKIAEKLLKLMKKTRQKQELTVLLARDLLHVRKWANGMKWIRKDNKANQKRKEIVTWTNDFLNPNNKEVGNEFRYELDILNTLQSMRKTQGIEAFAMRILFNSMLNKNRMDNRKQRIDSFLMKNGQCRAETVPFYPALTVLRRYNSTSPIVPRAGGNVVRGGGYFIQTAKKKGIVIDPGVRFLQNFYDEGFSIEDIDAIIITHAHVDHTAELEEILTLLYEYNDNCKNKKAFQKKTAKEITLLLNVGSMNKMLPWALSQQKTVLSIQSLCPPSVNPNSDNRTRIDLKETFGINVEVIRVNHNEVISDSFSIGLIITVFDEKGSQSGKLALTSDTGYFPALANHFVDCNPIIVHLGDTYWDELLYYALAGRKLNFPEAKRKIDDAKKIITDTDGKYKKVEGNYCHQSHLALAGVFSLTEQILKAKKTVKNCPDIIISEYPEEIGSYRTHIAKSLKEAFLLKGKKLNIISSDIGLTIAFNAKQKPIYRCDICHFDDFFRKNAEKNIFYSANDLASQCIHSESERIEYRCNKHLIPQKRLWIQGSKYWHRKILTSDISQLE